MTFESRVQKLVDESLVRDIVPYLNDTDAPIDFSPILEKMQGCCEKMDSIAQGVAAIQNDILSLPWDQGFQPQEDEEEDEDENAEPTGDGQRFQPLTEETLNNLIQVAAQALKQGTPENQTMKKLSLLGAGAKLASSIINFVRTKMLTDAVQSQQQAGSYGDVPASADYVHELYNVLAIDHDAINAGIRSLSRGQDGIVQRMAMDAEALQTNILETLDAVRAVQRCCSEASSVITRIAEKTGQIPEVKAQTDRIPEIKAQLDDIEGRNKSEENSLAQIEQQVNLIRAKSSDHDNQLEEIRRVLRQAFGNVL
jgi:hypothetical protein